ncbi:phosphosulfolactate synthase [Mucilaginibacter gotjawali]|uniref:Phosphosulfolactate synthase n=2 Tax=Mucilaginibacter gotjawali TaxID=1550579 RepID=A0A839SN72_9SPHI|nr:phosphosulfolactate synthase [Mucilaginibacter gotjawali]MBB3057939.1 phosphosulfolactate synthase [Mucilaginibacter gotjawali]BAU52289.1 Phosphosulfolactate synthase [Mucilaginibacter gotjawali]
MNYQMNNLPERAVKPRNSGITMVMDKGLSLRQVEDFIDVAGTHTDIVKLGWATSFVTPKLQEKLDIYRSAGIPVYFGGTLFEAFLIRNQFDDYCRILDKYKMEYVEVSDGSIEIEHEVKCEYIQKLSKLVTVISEVGSKDVQKIFAPYKWIKLMKAEIEAGSWKVIAEARESGNVGIYRDSGEVRQGLVDEILTQIPEETIIWEAPQKAQQVWFIKLIGANVNLGNIAPAEVIPLETLRLGIRSDTFDHFL